MDNPGGCQTVDGTQGGGFNYPGVLIGEPPSPPPPPPKPKKPPEPAYNPWMVPLPEEPGSVLPRCARFCGIYMGKFWSNDFFCMQSYRPTMYACWQSEGYHKLFNPATGQNYELPANDSARFGLITVIVSEPVQFVNEQGKTVPSTVWCLYNARWSPGAQSPGGGTYNYRNCRNELIQVRY